MKKLIVLGLLIITLILIIFGQQQAHTAAQQPPVIRTISPAEIAEVMAMERTTDNLLTNGYMDIGFYPRPPNHYVAFPWFEWWGDYTTIPEYIDGGHPYHNECYPIPVDDKCHGGVAGNNSSQGYILWNKRPFIAGIYQPVSGVTPCTLYNFSVYNRNDAANYVPQIAIDVSGWIITRMGNSDPENCPPDGASRCPDPYIAAFPATTHWSAPANIPAYQWGQHSLTAEAIHTTISVWTRAAPGVGNISQSTYWDAAELTQVDFPNGRLPTPALWEPTGLINNVTTVRNHQTFTITWETLVPASTQVWYQIENPAPPITPTPPVTHTNYPPQLNAYLPLVARSRPIPSPTTYTQHTPLDATPTTHHQVVISNITENAYLYFVPLSRRVVGTQCVTEADFPRGYNFATAP